MTPPRDPVGLAMASLGAGATTGAVVVTAGMFVLRSMQTTWELQRNVETGSTIVGVVLVLGIGAAATSGWVLSRPLNENWRRGVIGTLSVFGAALLASFAMPADLLAGRGGLMIYLAVLLVGLTYAYHRARRAAL